MGLHRGLEAFFVDVLGIEDTRFHLVAKRARGLNDGLTAAVRQRQAQGHFAIARRISHERLQWLSHETRQSVDIADGDEANVVVHDFGSLVDDVVTQKLHEQGHFVRRSQPVLRRKSVQGQRTHTDLARGPHHLAHRHRAPAMALDARQSTLLGPATIPVHDDGNVARQATWIRRHLGFSGTT